MHFITTIITIQTDIKWPPRTLAARYYTCFVVYIYTLCTHNLQFIYLWVTLLSTRNRPRDQSHILSRISKGSGTDARYRNFICFTHHSRWKKNMSQRTLHAQIYEFLHGIVATVFDRVVGTRITTYTTRICVMACVDRRDGLPAGSKYRRTWSACTNKTRDREREKY